MIHGRTPDGNSFEYSGGDVEILRWENAVDPKLTPGFLSGATTVPAELTVANVAQRDAHRQQIATNKVTALALQRTNHMEYENECVYDDGYIKPHSVPQPRPPQGGGNNVLPFDPAFDVDSVLRNNTSATITEGQLSDCVMDILRSHNGDARAQELASMNVVWSRENGKTIHWALMNIIWGVMLLTERGLTTKMKGDKTWSRTVHISQTLGAMKLSGIPYLFTVLLINPNTAVRDLGSLSSFKSRHTVLTTEVILPTINRIAASLSPPEKKWDSKWLFDKAVGRNFYNKVLKRMPSGAVYSIEKLNSINTNDPHLFDEDVRRMTRGIEWRTAVFCAIYMPDFYTKWDPEHEGWCTTAYQANTLVWAKIEKHCLFRKIMGTPSSPYAETFMGVGTGASAVVHPVVADTIGGNGNAPGDDDGSDYSDNSYAPYAVTVDLTGGNATTAAAAAALARNVATTTGGLARNVATKTGGFIRATAVGAGKVGLCTAFAIWVMSVQ